MSHIVISPGSMIVLHSGLDVIVLAVLIRGPLVQYEVSWLSNGDRKTAWIESFEISKNLGESSEIGFRS